jgi:acyl dehydratase
LVNQHSEVWRALRRVDAFARAVEDRHWAHHDVERALRGPFGGTIGHAHLTLGLVLHLFASLSCFADGEDAMFYGYNRVRFPTAVLVGSSVRMRADIVDVSIWAAASS